MLILAGVQLPRASYMIASKPRQACSGLFTDLERQQQHDGNFELGTCVHAEGYLQHTVDTAAQQIL